MPTTTSYQLPDFVRDLTAVVERTDSDQQRVEAAEGLLARLLADASWLPAEKQEPAPRGYARYPLYQDPRDRFEIMALVWRPGEGTTLHDHDGTWGAEGVICGQMQVTNFVRTEELAGDLVRLAPAGTVTVGARATGQLLPPADCHVLTPCADELTITVHVYGKQLRQFRIFEPTAEPGVYSTRLQVVGYTAPAEA